ncbi:MAG: OsmC family protein [Gemmatimonadaceae bacterium]
MPKSHEYRGHLRWSGSRHGPTSSYEAYSREHTFEVEGKPPIHGSADPIFRGDAARYNPEDLLLAALSACHLLAYLALAARAGIAVVSYEDSAVATLTFAGGGGQFTEAILRPHVVIAPGHDEALAQRLHDQAHEQCFIAASVSFPVRHEPTVARAIS